jgi:proteasome lid subunit RPN8/RPN11
VLRFPPDLFETMVGHCIDCYPLEGCGLLGGDTDPGDGHAGVRLVFPADNIARSARVYEVDPRAMLRADREAEGAGGQLVGVFHSHTHTDAKPSPTDIAQAPDPGWHYVIVSLRDVHPSVRSWAITDGKIEEEPIVLQW